MKDYNDIMKNIVKIENELNEKRLNINEGRGQNLDLVNEPLFNQAQALRWVLDLSIDEEIDEIDIDLLTD